MTKQELYEKLYNELAEKAEQFLEADKNLTEVDGFADFNDVVKYNEMKSKWQKAWNDYFTFLALEKQH